MNISSVSGPQKISCGCIKSCFMLFSACIVFLFVSLFGIYFFVVCFWIRKCHALMLPIHLMFCNACFANTEHASYRTSQRQHLLEWIFFCQTSEEISFLFWAVQLTYWKNKAQHWHVCEFGILKIYFSLRKKISFLSSART